ncbi:hypothetical protein AVO45_15660 [Ruegeria marisrubri]|uniref:Uncharacterized protein n=1 Tax=Ruegeria marisrubri TaxID=1685379 RepID=A0A0X3TBI3_9RHOB|nr:hypothetical protein [Ruegeria marisrubri]KUJ73177.1 hypothetical protein AVO45_15660 [Ruegeria marisrubri]
MVDTQILDMLAEIGRSVSARVSPAVHVQGETAELRRSAILKTIRGTVLPRRLEFTAANGDLLALEVGSSRVTDVIEGSQGELPDFETDSREEITERLASLISAISSAPAPLELVSLRPDTDPDADDVGITMSEIEKACAAIELPGDPRVAVVSDDSVPESAPEPVAEPQDRSLARDFFQGSERFATGRVLIDSSSLEPVESDGLCSAGAPLCPSADALAQFARDLAGWDADSASTLTHPQLIVLRPSGGKAAGLAIFRDGSLTSAAVHETRKLGAVVSLWKTLAGGST